VHHRITKRDFPIRHIVWAIQDSRGGQVVGQRPGAVGGPTHQESAYREFWGRLHIDIANHETPMGSYMAGVIW
jgi:hypothetical protein